MNSVGSLSGILTVVIVDGKDIKFNTFLGNPNPYIILRIGSIKFQTEVCEKQDKPIWNCRFTIDLQKFNERDEISFELYDYNPYISDTLISKWSDTLKNTIQTSKANRTLELEQQDKKKTKNGKLKVNFEYYNDKKDSSSKAKETTSEFINSDNSEGVLRINVLNGTKLMRSKDATQGSISISTIDQSTKKFKQENPTINQKFFLQCKAQKESIEIVYKLMNFFGSVDTNFDVGYIKQTLDQLSLVANKPKCTQQNFMEFNQLSSASLMCEYTFLKNSYTRSPIGIIKIKIERVDNINIKKAFYTFSNGDELNKFYLEGPSFFVETKSVLDDIKINLFANKDLLEYEQNKERFSQLDPDCTCTLLFSELNWVQNQQDDIERDASITLSFVTNKVATKVTLSLVHRNEYKWSQVKQELDPLVASFKRQPTVLASEKTPQNLNVSQQVIQASKSSFHPNQMNDKKSQKKKNETLNEIPANSLFNILEDKTFTNLAQDAIKKIDNKKEMFIGQNFFATIKKIQLNGVNLDDLGKINLYAEVSIPSLNYRCFTSICENQFKFNWKTNIPAHFIKYTDQDSLPISVKFYDLYVNSNQQEGDIISSKFNEIISFAITAQNLENPTILTQQRGQLKSSETTVDIGDAKISSTFQLLYKKILSQKNKSLDEFTKNITRNSKLSISYTQNKSIFIDQPLGILTIESIIGENVQFTNRDILNSLFVFELNNQIIKTDEQINNQKNPKWQKRIKLFTTSVQDILRIKFFDYSNTLSSLMFEMDQRVADLPIIYSENVNSWKLPLSSLNPEIEGNFILNFNYIPITTHPFYKQIQNSTDLNEKIFWVERYEKRDQFIKSNSQLKISLKMLDLILTPKDTHAQITINAKNDKFISPKIHLNTISSTFNNICENFRINVNPFDIEDQILEIELSILTSKDNKNYQITSILNGQFEWTKYPLKKHKENQISIEMKNISIRGVAATNEKMNQIVLLVDILDSISLSNYSNSILNITPLQINNINYSLPLNDIFIKTSCQYVLKLYIDQQDIVNQFFYAMPGIVSSTSDTRNVVFIPSQETYFKVPFKALSLQKMIIQESNQQKDRSLSFGERVCSFFSKNANQKINVELIQITDMTVKHVSNIDYQQLDSSSIPLLRGTISMPDIFNVLNDQDQSQNFAVKLLKQNHPNLISSEEANMNPIGIQQEEIVLIFQAEFRICDKRIEDENNILQKQDEQEEQKQQQQQDQQQQNQLVNEYQDGLIKIKVDGVYGINQQNNHNNSNDSDAQIFSNQIIFKQIEQQSLAKQVFNKAQQYFIPQDETPEFFRNDNASFNSITSLIHHPQLSDIPISLIKHVIEFLNFDKSKRYIKRKYLEQFNLNMSNLKWMSNQGLSMSILLQNDALHRSAVLNLSLQFMQNKFTQNYDSTLLLKSFEILSIKPKDFLNTFYFNFYIQGFDTKEGDYQKFVAHSNNTYPIVKNITEFKQSYQGSRVLQASEFKQTDNGFQYNQQISFKCSSLFDALTIDLCDSGKNDSGILSKYKIALSSIRFPSSPSDEDKKDEDDEDDQEEEIQNKSQVDEQKRKSIKSLSAVQRIQRKEEQIKTIIQKGLKKINEENQQKNIEIQFFLVIYNSLNIIKRIPCKIVLEQVIGDIEESKNNALSLINIAKIKGKLTSVREKLYKIYYYDSKMNAYEFNQAFRKKFKGMSLMYLRQRFGGMTKIYNNPDFKKEIPKFSNDSKQLWHFTIPSNTSLQIKGSIKIKYSFNIGIMIKSADKNQPLEKINAQFKRDAFSFREERGDDGEEIELTEIIFNREIDFYIPDEIIKNSQQIIVFLKYMNKDGQVKIEEGDIPRQSILNIQQSIKSPDDLFQSHTLLSFIRPSNFRLIILSRVISSGFYLEHKGELSVQIHKIIQISSSQINDAKGLSQVIRYNNKKIIAKNNYSDKVSVFAMSQMKLKVRVNGQNEFTNMIDPDGCIIQNEFKTHKFLTSHYNDRIDLKLIMTGQSKEQLNKINRNNASNENDIEEIDEENKIDEEGEIEQENADEYLKEDRSINLCKGSFYLVDSVYAKPTSEEFFFIQPLQEMIYHQNDVMKQFYNILNRKNLYVLGSYKFSPLHWAKVFMKITGVQNVNLNHDHPIISQLIKRIDENPEIFKDELVYFGVKLKTMVYYADYSADIINEYSTSLIEISLNSITTSLLEQKPISFEFTTPEKVSVIFKQSNEIENIAIEMKLIMMIEGKEYELSQRLYPVKKMCEQKYINHVINLNLELNESCTSQQVSQNIIFIDTKKCPTLISKIQAKQEMKIKRNQNEFDKLVIEKKEKKQSESEKLNFRNTTLVEIILNLLGCTQRRVILQIIKEIQELFLYLDYSQYKMYFKVALLTLMNMIRVYYDDFEITQQCLVNICNLSSQDLNQYLELFKSNNGLSIVNELASILSKIKLVHINKPGTKENNKINSKNKPSLVLDYKNMKQNFSVPILTLEQLKTNDFTNDDIFKIILSNRLKYLDAMKDENGVLKLNKNNISSQNDFEQLDFSEKEIYLQSKGVQSLQLLKLVDFYVGKSVDHVMECVEICRIIDDLLIDSMGKIKNMVSLYTMIATKLLSLTISEENEKILGLDIFCNFLNTLCNSSENLNVDDTLIALKTACNLFSHLSYKKDFVYISKTYFNYFTFVFSLIGSKKVTRYVFSEIIDSLVKDIAVISTDSQNIIKKKFSELLYEKNMVRKLEKILEEELLESYVMAENEKELFNEDIIVENIFKFLTILARDFDYPQSEFDILESTLKSRQKTVKKPRRKATIENFLNFLFNKSQGLQNLNKYDITKRKEALLQKKKQDLISDPVKLKNELATKYLISRLDWK